MSLRGEVRAHHALKHERDKTRLHGGSANQFLLSDVELVIRRQGVTIVVISGKEIPFRVEVVIKTHNRQMFKLRVRVGCSEPCGV